MKHARTNARDGAQASRQSNDERAAQGGLKKPHARSHARQSRYVPALDGLRSFAVISVIVYHMSLGWAPGGLMGVTVFFMILGYLINGLLVAERDRTGTSIAWA